MPGRRLKVHVSVHGGPGGTHTFGPDDDLPEWAEVKLADNPLVWEDGDEPTDEDKKAAVKYNEVTNEELAQLRTDNEYLRGQLVEKDQRIAELEAQLAAAPNPEGVTIEDITFTGEEPAPDTEPTGDEPETQEDQGDGLDDLDVDELKALAAEREIDINRRWGKERLIEALRAGGE
jgi:hypothetical protein